MIPAHTPYWQETDSNPFRLSVKGDRVYGLGTNSGKLDFLLRMLSLSEVKEGSSAIRPVLVGGFGHFLKKEGARFFLKSTTSKIHSIVVSEPSNLKFNQNYSGTVVVKLILPFSEVEYEVRKKFFSDEVTATQTKIFHSEPHFSFHSEYQNEILQQIRNFIEKLPDNTVLLNLELGESPYLIPSEGLVEMDLSDTKEQDLKERFILVLETIEKLFDSKFSKYIKKYDLESFPSYNLGFVRTVKEGIEMEGCFYLTHGVDKERVKEWLKPLNQAGLKVENRSFSCRQ